MCGIVGYIGPRSAVPILLDGLKKLEYRGYDSAGVAVLNDGHLWMDKCVGKLAVLEGRIGDDHPFARIGIGHTRWATHGRPSDTNSHPHTDCSGKFAAVHNGIIENFLPLREWLESEGHVFRSETDTEVLPHLVEHFYKGDLREAVRQVMAKVEGSYALVVVTEHEPDKLVAARKDSPLVVGLGKGENFFASDVPALLAHTRDTYILDDGEVAVISRKGVEVTDQSGNPIKKDLFRVEWDAQSAEKGGYQHFMLKEIHEQPRALRDTLTGRLAPDNSRVVLDEIKMEAADVAKIDKVYIVACGTAYHAGLIGKRVIEKLAKIPVEVDIASEFRYRDLLVTPNDLVIVISQSGETADTLAALRASKAIGARVLAVTNVVSSSVSREADDVIYTWAGPEIAVASTKAYTTQLICMYLLALYLGQAKGTLAPEAVKAIIAGLRELPVLAEKVLDDADGVKELAARFAACEDTFFIGRGLDYAVALEGALKLKEISYIHAEAYAAGELKHGTLALVVENTPVLALVTQKGVQEKTLSNIKEVKAREAPVVGITFAGNEDVEKSVDYMLYIPDTQTVLAPVLTALVLQLYAYYASLTRGCDIDQPRNLAKAVTVE